MPDESWDTLLLIVCAVLALIVAYETSVHIAEIVRYFKTASGWTSEIGSLHAALSLSFF